MNRLRQLSAFGLILLSAGAIFAETKEEKQAKARQKANETLQKLYKAHPTAEAAIKKAVGYAVFNNGGAKILIAGGGRGKGIAVENATQKVTYMKMREIQ